MIKFCYNFQIYHFRLHFLLSIRTVYNLFTFISFIFAAQNAFVFVFGNAHCTLHNVFGTGDRIHRLTKFTMTPNYHNNRKNNWLDCNKLEALTHSLSVVSLCTLRMQAQSFSGYRIALYCAFTIVNWSVHSKNILFLPLSLILHVPARSIDQPIDLSFLHPMQAFYLNVIYKFSIDRKRLRREYWPHAWTLNIKQLSYCSHIMNRYHFIIQKSIKLFFLLTYLVVWESWFSIRIFHMRTHTHIRCVSGVEHKCIKYWNSNVTNVERPHLNFVTWRIGLYLQKKWHSSIDQNFAIA